MAEDRGQIAHGGRRRSDLIRDRLLVVSALINLAALVVLGLGTTGLVAGHQALDDVKVEARDRRDQTCVLFERQHATAVERLGNTYAFLATVEPEDRDDAIYRAVLRGLPSAEADARQSTAPPYCDARHVGLPEPNPELPRRPAFLSR